jgi:L-ascorbate metabolism protein UlaG (beta-lactamase superfamily)
MTREVGRYPLSDHFDGRCFFNPQGETVRGWRDLWKWKRTSKAAPWQKSVAISPVAPPAAPCGEGVAATWINHATYLLQTAEGAILTDPVFSSRAGPLGLAGPRRVHPPGVPFEKLPRISIVLLSHDHYDHCDLPSLRRLAREHDPLVVTLLGNGQLAGRAGLRKIVELDWWQRYSAGNGISITATPAQHWSNRVTGSRNERLWGGFSVRAGGRLIQFVGDSGYDDRLFRRIRERTGAPDLALVPIGAYEPRWFMAPVHCSPAEAVLIHLDLGARTSLAMHWGCWQLSDEAREAPPEALREAREAAGILPGAFRILEPGKTCVA